MTASDGKFWGPVVQDGDRVVAWTRWDSPVPGAVEAMYDGVPMRFLRYRDGAIVRLSDAERQEILDAEAAQADQREADALAAAVAAEAQRQADAAAADQRYVAENEYILLCDAIAGTPGAYTRLGLGDLQTALVGLIAASPARQNAIFQYLMGLQIGLQRLGGVNWWDSCTWHDQPAIVNAARERHGAIMAVMP